MTDSALVAVLLDDRGCLRVTGSERKSWLGRLLSSDVGALEPGAAQLGLLLTQQGKILTDALVADAGETLFVGPEASRAGDVEDVLGGYLIMEDVELADDTAEREWFGVFGADAGAVADRTAMGLDAFAACVDVGGLEGALLVARRTERDAVRAALTASRVHMLDDAGWTSFRVRHGLVRFGTDYGPDDRPHEASLDRIAVSWTKGCYLGQEVVCMQDMRGKVRRRLALVRVAGAEPIPARCPVQSEGETVGEVTSSTLDSGETLAIARLVAPHFSETRTLSIGGRAAEVVASPLSPVPPR